jgi:hypothetical protein
MTVRTNLKTGDPRLSPGVNEAFDSLGDDAESRERSFGVIGEMADPAYDQAVADDYYQSVSPGLDQSFYEKSKDVAADYARRGLSSSGMSVKAQVDESFDHAARLRQARQQAINYAKNQRRQQLVDEALMWNDWNKENADIDTLEQQDQMNDINGIMRLGGLIGSFAS